MSSFSSNVPLLARRQPNGEPEPDEPPKPPTPPPPPVSAPDLAIQFLPCLENIPAPPGFDLRAAVINALREAFGANSDVRYLCLAGKGTVGIWLRPFVTSTDSDARNRGMQRVDLLQPGENFAFFISSGLIRRSAQDAWDSMPKRLNGDGNPDSGGPIHLTGLSVVFSSPNRILTVINGFDERPWPDVDFKLTITDTLSLSGGEVHCDSSSDLDVDTSWLNFLSVLFGIVFPPLGIAFIVQRIIISTVDAPSGQSGAGCEAARLIPDEIMIPGGLKLSAFYRRLSVSSGGIFLGGTAAPAPRTPAVSIRGRTQLSVNSGVPTASASYSVVTDDLLEPLRYAWTADGSVLAPGAASTTVRFSVGGSIPGDVLTKRVAVRVTDRDNLAATAEVIVRIHVTDPDLEEPPICKKKPWLPQCQPQ